MRAMIAALLILAAAPAAASDKYWAYASTMKDRYSGWAYGAAWNFDDLSEAKKAALKECEKGRTPGSYECIVWREGKNGCFAVIKHDMHDKKKGLYSWFLFVPATGNGYPSRAEAEVMAEEDRASTNASYFEEKYQYSNTSTIDLLACSAVD